MAGGGRVARPRRAGEEHSSERGLPGELEAAGGRGQQELEGQGNRVGRVCPTKMRAGASQEGSLPEEAVMQPQQEVAADVSLGRLQETSAALQLREEGRGGISAPSAWVTIPLDPAVAGARTGEEGESAAAEARVCEGGLR